MDTKNLLQKRYETLSDRLSKYDQYDAEVGPMVRGELLDMSKRPAGVNPMGNFQSAIEFSEGARNARNAVSNEGDQILSKIMQLDQTQLDNAFRERQLSQSQSNVNREFDLQGRKFEADLLKGGLKYNEETGQLEALDQKGLTEEKIKAESTLRNEYSTRTKETGFNDVKTAYQKIKNIEPTAAGDLSLVFAYMKMLDPGSTVREGEYASAENARGIPATIQNYYNKVLSGEKLTEQQRTDFKNQAKSIYKTYEKTQKELNSRYEKLADEYGVDKSRVVTEITDTDAQPNEIKVLLFNGQIGYVDKSEFNPATMMEVR